MNDKLIYEIKKIETQLKTSKLDQNDLIKLLYYIHKMENTINQKESLLNLKKKYGTKEKNQKKRSFNNLTASEWAKLSKNVWNDVSSVRRKKHLDHGATFSEKLADRIITMYSKEDDLVFDPFVGTGTTLFSTRNLNRKGIGIELNSDFCKTINSEISNKDLFHKYDQKIINDDCRNLEKYLKDDSIQLTLTSPPYANFIHKTLEDRNLRHKNSAIVQKNNSRTKLYSSSKNDFGNLSYPEFLKEINVILRKIYKKTKIGGYSVWIVKDYRDTKNKIPYISFHSCLCKIGQEVGFKFHDLIIWDQNFQRSLILLGYPTVFYTNQNCSFLVIFRK